MALFKTVVRKYTPPTCSLEVRGKESLLSRWAGRTILQDLKFKLSFDDPRQPDDKQVSIWGDRTDLEELSTAVSDYVQNFLQSRDGDTGLNGAEPITDSLPRKKTNSRMVSTQTEASPVASDTSATKVIPISSIFQRQTLNPYLKPKGLVNHELFLGALQTPESGPSIDLSALQLFDLATALDAYSAEMLDMPALGQKRPSIPPWGYAAGAAAAVVAAALLTPKVMQLADTSNTSNSQSNVAGTSDLQENQSDSSSLTSNNEIAAIPSPLASPTPPTSPIGAVPPGQSLPFGAGVPGVTSTPGNTALNPPTGTPNNVPGVPNGLGSTGQPVPGINNGFTQPPTNSGKVAVGKERSQYQSDPQGVRLSPFQSANANNTVNPNSLGNFRSSPSNQSKSSSSQTRTTTKNQLANNRPVARQNQPRKLKTLGTGQVTPFIYSGDNPVNFGDVAQGENSSSKPKKTRTRRSSNSRQQPQVAINQPVKEFEVPSGTSGIPPFTLNNNVSVPPSSDSSSETQVETPNPVVSQAVPNKTPPSLGELPPIANSPTPTTVVSPVPSSNLDSSSVAISPSPNGASALIPSTNPVTPITVPTPDPSQSSVNNDLAFRSLDSIQASEVKRYFEGQWKPIKEVNQSLEYTLVIEPNGSVARIISITEISRQYIDRTGMPKLTNTPMVSPVGASRSVKIRVSLDPDGTVKTFQEP